MGPKKSPKNLQGKENNGPSTLPTKKQEPQVTKKPQLTRDKQQDKVDGHNKKPGTESKPKQREAGKEPTASVKWALEGSTLFESAGNKVTLLKEYSHAFEYTSMAMLIEDGAGVPNAPVSGEHFWTINFGGLKSNDLSHPFAGVTTSRWFKKKYGLFYAGTLLKSQGYPKVEFGPVINSGDVIGVLCSFSEKDLNVYFYHNSRCLGLTFQVPASLFLPEGIHPCVKLNQVGEWATITKEPQEKIPKEKDRVRAPVSEFGVEGFWRFKSLVDSTSGNEIPLNLSENKIQRSRLQIRQTYLEDSKWTVQLIMTHYVKFIARKKKHNLWNKTSSLHALRGRSGPVVLNHRNYPDFPIIEVINNPEKVVLQKQEMRVTKGETTAVFDRIYKIKKGNVFNQEFFE